MYFNRFNFENDIFGAQKGSECINFLPLLFMVVLYGYVVVINTFFLSHQPRLDNITMSAR